LTEEELMVRFELASQSIATWTAATAEFVRAAAEKRETGNSALQAIFEAQRMLSAVREEATALSDASLALRGKSDEFKRGIATALEELNSLDNNLSDAIAQMQ
jgi:nitric oxide reductase activation protein